jgi:hypothetical protein
MPFVFLLCSLCSKENTLDWDLVIKRNGEALKGIIDDLFAMLGLDDDTTVSRISHPLHRAVLRLLRPAESAVRRLIVIAARGLVVKLAPSRPNSPPRQALPRAKGMGSSRPPSFQLFDPRQRLKPVRAMKSTWREPGISFLPPPPDPTVAAIFAARAARAPAPAAAPAPPPSDGLASAQGLTRRLEALKLALEDLPHQAKRLARWYETRKAAPDFKFLSPLRPGRPPGYRRKPIHEVDEVLVECDDLAWEAMKPDTS